MYIWFFIALLCLRSFLFAELPETLSEQPTCLIGEVAPCGFVNDTVDVVEGNLFLRLQHLSVPGHVPLDLVQYYNNQSGYSSWTGVGFSLNYSFWMQGKEKAKSGNHHDYDALLAEYPGGSIISCIAVHDSSGTTNYHIDPEIIHKSFTNCGSGYISARTNIKNIRLKEKIDSSDENWQWTAYYPDGTVREYKRAHDKEDPAHVLSESRPNKSRLSYSYKKSTRDYYENKHLGPITKIKASAKHEMNWLSFSLKEDESKAKIKSSNGLSARFYAFRKDKRHYINHIETTENPTVHFNYTHAGKHYCIDLISWPEGRFLEIEYDDKARVIAQKAPVGKNDEKRTIYSFDYHSDHTNVVDANGNKKVFCHKNSRITSIDDYKHDKLYRHKAYYWGEKEGISWGERPKSLEGNLLAHATLNEKHLGVSLCYYDYDSYGNIVKETLCGNLTGNCPRTFKIDSEGHPKDDSIECYHKYYKYSKDHLLVEQTEDNGPKLQYRYKSDCDLVWAKFTLDGDKIILREFYEYDDDGILIAKIVDDGDSDNKSWFSGVTKRLVTHIIPVKDKEGFGQGLAQDIWENYLDLETEALVPLKHTHYTYNKAGRVVKEAVFDANNDYCYSTQYDYDSKGRLHKKIDPIGNAFTYVYDDNNNKTYEKQENTDFHTIYEYDKANRLITATEYHYDGTEVRTSFEYDLMGNKVASYDRYGNKTSYVYDSLNRLSTVTDCQGFSIQKEYDLFDNVSKEVNQKGAVTKGEYTIRNAPYCITYADATEERYRYHKNGRLAHQWDRAGIRTSYTYDILGRLLSTSISDSSGKVLSRTSNTYNSFHLVSTTDAMGHTTEIRYDGAGRKVEEYSSSDDNFSKTTYEYDSLGRLACTRNFYDTRSVATHLKYDNLNRIVMEKTVDATGYCTSWTHYKYDARGNCILKRTGHDEEDAEIHSRFNSKNELVEQTDEAGVTTTITYNHAYVGGDGKKVLLKTTRDALKNTIEVYYDTLGREVKVIQKNKKGKRTRETVLSYNATGHKKREKQLVISHGRAHRDYVIRWQYDRLDRLIQLREQPDSADKKVTSYSYDACDRLLVIKKPDDVELHHTYDGLGRLIRLKSTDATIDYRYTYDRNNNPLKIRDKISGYLTRRSYDAWNRVTKDGAVSYTYDALGRPLSLTLPDASSVRYKYQYNHLKSVQRYSKDEELQYEHKYLDFDRKGRPKEAKLIHNLGKAHFVWDKKGRNTSIKTDYYSQYIDSFDAVGNVVSYTSDNVTTTNRYDSLYQLIKEEGPLTHTYKHDSLGNRLKKDDKVYTLDSHNKITSDDIVYDKNGNPIRYEDKTLSYDALDRLIEVSDGQMTTRYLYDSFNRRIKRNDETFIYQGMREIGTYKNGAITELRVLGLGKGAELGASVAIELGCKTYCPIHDYRGSIVCLVDAQTKTIAELYQYTAFGECTSSSTPIMNPWRFASKRHDPETGFIYFSHRYYTPTQGRWLTPDPSGFSDGPNLYAYVHNNPLTHFDLYGLFTETTDRVFSRAGNHVTTDSYIEISYKDDAPKKQSKLELLPRSREYSVGSYELSRGAVGFTNGIANSFTQAEKSAQQLSDIGMGVKIDAIYNASHTLPVDVLKNMAYYCGVRPSPARLYQEKWQRYVLTKPSDAKFLEIVHSGGAGLLKSALTDSPEWIRQKIIAVGIAPSVIIPRKLCYESHNYSSANDFVSHCDVIGKMNYGNELQILQPHPDAPFWDHDFLSPTFDQVKKRHISKYLEKYGDR